MTTLSTKSSQLTVEEARYAKAMEWLSYNDPNLPGGNRIEVYTEKQRIFTERMEQLSKAYREANENAKGNFRNTADRQAAYESWLKENARTQRNLCQAAYMDWMVTGKKKEVEYWFSIVDQGSAYSRLETRKELLRNDMAFTPNNGVQRQKLSLIPIDWTPVSQKKNISNAEAGLYNATHRLNSRTQLPQQAPQTLEVKNTQTSMVDVTQDENEAMVEPTDPIEKRVTFAPSELNPDDEISLAKPAEEIVNSGIDTERQLGDPETLSESSSASESAPSTPSTEELPPLARSNNGNSDTTAITPTVRHNVSSLNATSKKDRSARPQAAHDDTASKIHLTSEYMRADITRPWTRGEIFYDDDLVPSFENHVALGFGNLDILSKHGGVVYQVSDEHKELHEGVKQNVGFKGHAQVLPATLLSTGQVVFDKPGTITANSNLYSSQPFNENLVPVEIGAFATAPSYRSGTSKSPHIVGWTASTAHVVPNVERGIATQADETQTFELEDRKFAEATRGRRAKKSPTST